MKAQRGASAMREHVRSSAAMGLTRQEPERAPLFVGQGRHCTLVSVSRGCCSFQAERQAPTP
jgi:hypothetical protein